MLRVPRRTGSERTLRRARTITDVQAAHREGSSSTGLHDARFRCMDTTTNDPLDTWENEGGGLLSVPADDTRRLFVCRSGALYRALGPKLLGGSQKRPACQVQVYEPSN
jgi:hypothetical protein